MKNNLVYVFSAFVPGHQLIDNIAVAGQCASKIRNVNGLQNNVVDTKIATVRCRSATTDVLIITNGRISNNRDFNFCREQARPRNCL